MRIYLTILFCFLCYISNGQINGIYSSIDQNNYKCNLRIDKNGQVFLVYPAYYNYQEYKGRIKKINDTLFRVDISSLFQITIYKDESTTYTDLISEESHPYHNKLILEDSA